MRSTISITGLAVAILFAGCTSTPKADVPQAPIAMQPDAIDDLPIGDLPADDKADGDWGHALECKPIPALPQLVAPRIIISLDGLTLHLVDAASGYDKVFPIGPGQIESDEAEPSYGESKSYYPILATGGHDFALNPSTANACRSMWTDPDTGEQSPVFAGLPFIPFFGAYAIHGPIDGYRNANGGSLRRGFVSHGCVRLEAADITEIYARTKTLTKVPVHLQREPERLADGTRVDLVSRWMGSECKADADCNYAGGVCHTNPYGGRGFCTASCTKSCSDRAGAPTTFCVADPADATRGICASKAIAQDADCRAFGEMNAVTRTRFNQASASSPVCLPGSRGSIGDPCLADGECRHGATCSGKNDRGWGYCSATCLQYCPDEPGYPTTACTANPIPSANLALGCLRSCTPESNASECEGGTACVRRDPTSAKDRRSVCRPVR